VNIIVVLLMLKSIVLTDGLAKVTKQLFSAVRKPRKRQVVAYSCRTIAIARPSDHNPIAFASDAADMLRLPRSG
jgi:hypothetical protein